MNRETPPHVAKATANDNRPIYVRLADELSELLETGQLKALRLNCGRRMTPELDAAVARLGRLAVRMVQ